MEIHDSLDMDRTKADACDALRRDANGYLDSGTVTRRLKPLQNALVLDGDELVQEIYRKTGYRISRDAVGGVIVFDGEDKLGRVALLEATNDEMEAYHTAVHEGVHLLGPDSVVAHSGWDSFDRYVIHKSLGPKWTSFTFNDDGSVADVNEIPSEEKLFWEAVTDYVAMQQTAEKFGQEAVDQQISKGGNSGFIQRYWIKFLIEHHPNPDELSDSMKKALYQGDMREFLRIIGGRLDNSQVPFYHTLVHYMWEGEQALNAGDAAAYDKAIDDFMSAVKTHFRNGGAYSLDMTNF